MTTLATSSLMAEPRKMIRSLSSREENVPAAFAAMGLLDDGRDQVIGRCVFHELTQL